ncbi:MULTISPECIES: hypothetical protein [Lacticaseibacillus]|uniref:Uncharacterized protein n=2 Tax=Lacticaseibacillus zeae TaxID=57037 RepID=A0A5R8LQS6_LACZE|nr:MULTISPECIES: hypothetical protein [Lacticaseibacillus]OFR97167.1 hypothetical protein HMPREF2861_07065 [Lactobacillus sp. HMSC068F07]KLI75569.1 hypothetical protein AAW28_08700 [Lacticaseibacillus casei]MDE3316679.1 hypothetical protein [Lacticaseibacillus zeae]TLF39589.1 hypothetical protein FEI15_06420 [Lacticaseibacillus zeae]WLV83471.1 hypothetical protein LACZS2_002712 [Lacticaseibacillus sp. NCIMB 15475]
MRWHYRVNLKYWFIVLLVVIICSPIAYIVSSWFGQLTPYFRFGSIIFIAWLAAKVGSKIAAPNQ